MLLSCGLLRPVEAQSALDAKVEPPLQSAPTATPLPKPTVAPAPAPIAALAPAISPDEISGEVSPAPPTSNPSTPNPSVANATVPQTLTLRRITPPAPTSSSWLAAPTQLTARLGSGQVVLQWRNNSRNASGFGIERAFAGEAWRLLPLSAAANQTSYTDTVTVSGRRISYRVRAFDAGTALSDYSNTASVGVMAITTGGTTAPVARHVFTISASHSDLTTGQFMLSVRPENVRFNIVLEAQASASDPNPPASIRFLLYRAKTQTTIPVLARTVGRGRYQFNWDVTRVLGSWIFRVRPAFGTSVVLGTSDNFIPVKLNKRAQIAKLALHWAEIWPGLNYQHGTTSYPEPPRTWIAGVPIPRTVFAMCDGFVGYIYDKLGLSHTVNANAPGLPLDSGVGALRNFREFGDGSVVSARNPTFAHVAIIVGDISLGELSMVDVNNSNDATGPTQRNLNYSGHQYWGEFNPVNRGFPDPSVRGRTQLQVLDAENRGTP